MYCACAREKTLCLLVLLFSRWILCNDFYPATRIHSADHAMARSLFICPSVRHTPVLCLNDYIILKVFSPSGSPTILVFLHQTGWQYSDRNPLNGGVECKEGIKNHYFWRISRFISQMMQDRVIVTMAGE